MVDNQHEKISNRLNTREIIEAIIKHSGLNTAQFLKKIGLNQTFVQDVRNGKISNITRRTAVKVLQQYPEISESFLMTGIPPMLTSEQAGDIRDNSVGGDLLGHGATKNDSIEIQKLVDTIAILTETNRQQSEQISKLIDIIASKQ